MRTAVIAVLLAVSPAWAGGMVLPIHGVRSLSRAGAFTAGADGADALWQNPAGLAHVTGDGKRALLFDLALVYHPVDFTSTGGEGAKNEQPTQPVPTLAGSLGVGDRLVIAGGIAAPYQGLSRYPKASALRFASTSQAGSAVVVAAAGIAYRVSDTLRVGATVQNVFTKLAWQLVMSGCPASETCADDDRSFDLPIEIDQTDYLSPTGALGLQWDASPFATLGLAVQGPAKVSAGGAAKLALPTNVRFDGGVITGDAVRVSYWLPPALRAGVELHPIANLKVEAALGVELWSLHDEIAIELEDVAIENVAGGPLPFQRVAITRDFKTSYAASLGGEYHLPDITLAAGYAYETSAVPPANVSALTIDARKHLLAIGGGYDDGVWQIGGAIAYAIVGDVDAPGSARLAPIGMTAARDGAGRYATSYVVGGLRFARVW